MKSFKNSTCHNCGKKFAQPKYVYHQTCGNECRHEYQSTLTKGRVYGLRDSTKAKERLVERQKGSHRRVSHGTGDHEGDLV